MGRGRFKGYDMNGLPDHPKEEEGYFIAHGRKLSA
jgi:hypothetical protein